MNKPSMHSAATSVNLRGGAGVDDGITDEQVANAWAAYQAAARHDEWIEPESAYREWLERREDAYDRYVAINDARAAQESDEQ